MLLRLKSDKIVCVVMFYQESEKNWIPASVFTTFDADGTYFQITKPILENGTDKVLYIVQKKREMHPENEDEHSRNDVTS